MPIESIPPFQRFFRLDPLTILDENANETDFRGAMKSIYVGGTIKITGADRHPNADRFLSETLDLPDAVIADIGASDDTTSIDLIERLEWQVPAVDLGPAPEPGACRPGLHEPPRG